MKAWFPIILLALTALTSCKTNQNRTTSPELGEGEFHSFISQPGTLNIVDFHADWCGPCRTLGPVLEQVVRDHADLVQLRKVDVDAQQELASQQGVRSIPDVRFYIDGKLVHKFTGAYPKQQIEDMVATHIVSLPERTAGSSESGAGEPAIIEPYTEDSLPPGISRAE